MKENCCLPDFYVENESAQMYHPRELNLGGNGLHVTF